MKTTIEVTLNTNNIDEVLDIFSQTLEPSGFHKKLVDGAEVWAKGDGVVAALQCFGAVFTGRSVIIQGWIKDMITGESNLEGFINMMPKKKMKNLMHQIADEIVARQL